MPHESNNEIVYVEGEKNRYVQKNEDMFLRHVNFSFTLIIFSSDLLTPCFFRASSFSRNEFE